MHSGLHTTDNVYHFFNITVVQIQFMDTSVGSYHGDSFPWLQVTMDTHSKPYILGEFSVGLKPGHTYT